MANGLRMDVIAEGVETQEQHAFLLQQGCRKVQGYLIGKPMPVHEAEAFLSQTLPAATTL
jgi:EAL domain-containing protein (putative c-di-GMP-specific phosphodiesterase class I)